MNLNFWNKAFYREYKLPILQSKTIQELHIGSGKFIDVTIQDYAKTYIKQCSYCDFDMDGIHVHFSFYHRNASSKKIKFYQHLCAVLLHGLSQMKPQDTVMMNISLIDLPINKIKPKGAEPLSAKHVNSGVTTSYMLTRKKDVLVYRREEMMKVFIHEMIHAMDLDKKFIDEKHETNLRKFFNLQTRLNINETFTDTFAIYIHSIIVSIIQKRKFQEVFQNEKRFILRQAKKCLHVYGFKIGADKVLYEHTSAIAYYVLKAAMIDNINKWIAFMRNQNWYLHDEIAFIRLVESIVLDPRSTFWQKLENTPLDASKTMRMSCAHINNNDYGVESKLLKKI